MFTRRDLRQAEESEIQHLVDAIAMHESQRRHSAVGEDDPVVMRRVIRMLTSHAEQVRRQALQRVREWSLHQPLWRRLAPVPVPVTQVSAADMHRQLACRWRTAS